MTCNKQNIVQDYIDNLKILDDTSSENYFNVFLELNKLTPIPSKITEFHIKNKNINAIDQLKLALIANVDYCDEIIKNDDILEIRNTSFSYIIIAIMLGIDTKNIHINIDEEQDDKRKSVKNRKDDILVKKFVNFIQKKEKFLIWLN